MQQKTPASIFQRIGASACIRHANNCILSGLKEDAANDLSSALVLIGLAAQQKKIVEIKDFMDVTRYVENVAQTAPKNKLPKIVTTKAHATLGTLMHYATKAQKEAYKAHKQAAPK